MKTLLLVCTFDQNQLLGSSICFEIPKEIKEKNTFDAAILYAVSKLTPEVIQKIIDEDFVGDDFVNDFGLENQPSTIKLAWAGYRSYGFEFDFVDEEDNKVTIRKSVDFIELV